MKRRVLFLCTGNSARSQMAEALLTLIAPAGFEAASAGTNPAGLNPATVEAMRELGVDVSHHRSKHVEEFVGESFDYVITVCDRAKESCPVLPGAKRLLHWTFDDPAAAPPTERQAGFRRIRDEIADAIYEFLVDEVKISPGDLNCSRC